MLRSPHFPSLVYDHSTRGAPPVLHVVRASHAREDQSLGCLLGNRRHYFDAEGCDGRSCYRKIVHHQHGAQGCCYAHDDLAHERVHKGQQKRRKPAWVVATAASCLVPEVRLHGHRSCGLKRWKECRHRNDVVQKRVCESARPLCRLPCPNPAASHANVKIGKRYEASAGPLTCCFPGHHLSCALSRTVHRRREESSSGG